jgi:NAD(P)H-flavin reductase
MMPCRFPAWELMGVSVVPVFTTRGEGYVQDVYKNAGDSPPNPKSTCVLVCGQKEMAEAVYEIVEGQGISRENCLTNF